MSNGRKGRLNNGRKGRRALIKERKMCVDKGKGDVCG